MTDRSGTLDSGFGSDQRFPHTFEDLLPCPQKRLVLFDIDGTLLRCGQQVGPIFLESMESVFGSRGAWQGFSFGGKTDPQIVTELLAGEGHVTASVVERLPEIMAIYFERLERELDQSKMILLPGVVWLLEALAGASVHVGLLTGNWERGARAKLERFDLNRYFSFGAFGDDGIARAELPPAALRRAHQTLGRTFDPEEVLVVGDTPNDVHCAHAHGIQCLAVATGMVSAETLRDAGADWVVASLEQLGTALRIATEQSIDQLGGAR